MSRNLPGGSIICSSDCNETGVLEQDQEWGKWLEQAKDRFRALKTRFGNLAFLLNN